MPRLPAFLALSLTAVAGIEPGNPVDYSKLAFYPKRWAERGHETKLIPWQGKEVTFLTVSGAHDQEIMGAFVGSLDAGWKLYREFTGQKPRPHRLAAGKPPIAAVPGGGLTCGYGCGFVGATGIEMTNFYGGHYPQLQKNAKAVPHAYFYEMGRNFFTFGRRHDCFTTGFAVFMRYVCTDSLRLVDHDKGTRRVIDKAIAEYAESDLRFLRTFTNADGLSEKQNRLKSSPTDQPVMYASAMLQLWKTHGDDWLKAFYRQLASCPEANRRTKEGARTQCLSWFLAASCAAQRDLSDTFVGKWRLELSDRTRKCLVETDWKSAELNAGALLKKCLGSD